MSFPDSSVFSPAGPGRSAIERSSARSSDPRSPAGVAASLAGSRASPQRSKSNICNILSPCKPTILFWLNVFSFFIFFKEL